MSIFKAISPAIDSSYTVKALDADRLVLCTHNDASEVLELDLEHVAGEEYLLTYQGEQHPIYIHQKVDRYQIMYQGVYSILQKQMRGAADQDVHSGDEILAPLTGKVIQVNAVPGQAVTQGDTLVVLESMKMETALVSPRTGVIESVHCQENEQVGNEQILVKLMPPEPTALAADEGN